jgi:alkanesulfonate monooxygenase SsuD/methylene tetrahydromethanopterin reductase-like flavin-dependent oxidoreductase (luciferase family)
MLFLLINAKGDHMKFGITFPYIEPREIATLAKEAEDAGWDGVFVWDAIWGFNVWVTLAAVAMTTSRINMGPMLVPPSRRRPWELASEAAALDRLSGGRAVLAVGLGAIDVGWAKVGEATDRKIRAERMDEALDIITGLWTVKPFSYTGKYFKVDNIDTFDQPPLQKPGVPIWVVGAWNRPKSMQRAIRYQGILPANVQSGKYEQMTPQDLRDMAAYAKANRTSDAPLDVILEGETPGDDPAAAKAIVGPLADAGATWWLENIWRLEEANGIEGLRKRILQGPPKLD